MAGEAAPILEALERAFAVAVAEIDMESHTGEHPRIGAVDVVPFVPLGDTKMSECVELARAFGSRVADRFAVPVYLYGEAATDSGVVSGWRTCVGVSMRGSRPRSPSPAASRTSGRRRCTRARERWRLGRGRS